MRTFTITVTERELLLLRTVLLRYTSNDRVFRLLQKLHREAGRPTFKTADVLRAERGI